MNKNLLILQKKYKKKAHKMMINSKNIELIFKKREEFMNSIKRNLLFTQTNWICKIKALNDYLYICFYKSQLFIYKI